VNNNNNNNNNNNSPRNNLVYNLEQRASFAHISQQQKHNQQTETQMTITLLKALTKTYGIGLKKEYKE
jgi:hypothetical protein